jgi:hypothetical protein
MLSCRDPSGADAKPPVRASPDVQTGRRGGADADQAVRVMLRRGAACGEIQPKLVAAVVRFDDSPSPLVSPPRVNPSWCAPR